MNIQGFQKTTLLDYPKHVAATIFFGGCNFRCPFCHNGDLVLFPDRPSDFSAEDVLEYLNKRRNILDGVCITGGEPTLQKDLLPFIEKIKSLGLKVKLDTNGYRPEILKDLCNRNLIDYVAMDIKGSARNYAEICGFAKMDLSKIEESIAFLKSGSVDYEFRTTVVREFHKEEDFHAIGELISGAKSYFLQGYRESPQVISPEFSAYSIETLNYFRRILLTYLPNVEIRGMDQE